MEAKFVTVTPELAKEWLATSSGNPRWAKSSGKKVSRLNVEKIKRDIASGNYKPAGDTIRFGVDGNLLDGHHRLTAISEGNTEVELLVVTGVPKECELHIDDNARRTIGQRTNLHHGVAAMSAIGIALLTNSRTNRATDEERVAWLAQHPDAGLFGNIAWGGKVLHNAGCGAALLFAYEYGVSETKLREFASVVNSGYAEGLGAAAAITLRNMLLARPRPAFGDKLDICIWTQSALYDFVHETPRKIAYRAAPGAKGWYFQAMRDMGDKRYI